MLPCSHTGDNLWPRLVNKLFRTSYSEGDILQCNGWIVQWGPYIIVQCMIKVDQVFIYVFIYAWMFKVGAPLFGGTTDTLTVGTTLLFSL